MNDINQYKIIGFSSRKSSGKTLCANILQKYGYTILNFADGLKKMICHILNISNDYLEENKNNNELVFKLNEYDINFIHQETKIDEEKIIDVLNKYNPKTIRDYLQIIGTELIRKYDPLWHINTLKSKIIQNKDKKYCIADVRFLNEKTVIENLGGKCFYIIRPDKNNYDDISNHISELELNWMQFDNNILINDSSIENLICYGKTPENEKHYKKSKLFLTVDYKSAYLAGYIFLFNSNSNPFIIENYKLWKCSNKCFPDILNNLPTLEQVYYRHIWLKGICDYIMFN